MDADGHPWGASDHDDTALAPIICVVGPTATGKTELAQKIAQSVDGEVVSADSMQIYRGMDIGTGKVTPSERLVPHHGLDLVDPGEPFSAALFQTYARECFRDISARAKRTVLAGGTGFYIRAAIDGYTFPRGSQTDNPIREHYSSLAQEQGADALWKLLQSRDAASAALLPPRDVKRVVRAFELLESGTTYAEQRAKLASIPQVVPACLIGLEVNPDILADRIDARVDAMIEAGLVNEVKYLLQAGFRQGITAPQAIGYKEIVAVLDDGEPLAEAVADIKQATRRYAKRQRTWFRKDKRITWLCADSQDMDKLTEQALRVIATIETERR